MITRAEFDRACRRSADILRKAHLAICDEDFARIEAIDFGLGELEQTGLQILPLVDTEVVSVKLMIQLPHQTCPEHCHRPQGEYAGKEETFRCEWGELYLMTPGEPTVNPRANPPAHRRKHYTSWCETVLLPGEQFTSPPNSPHWFQAGPEGAVTWAFASRATDFQDVFTDPEMVRKTVIVEDQDRA